MEKEQDSQKVEITLAALRADQADRRKTKRLVVVCATICFVMTMAMVVTFALFASGLTITTETESTVVEQDTEGEGNNVFQAGEYATYSEDGAE